MHSHLIPGIDDGAKTLEDSISMIRHLMNLGYTKIITTPHIMGEYYPNEATTIEAGLTSLKDRLKKEHINIDIEAAAEYYIDDYFENLLNNETRLLTFANNSLLIEFSTFAAPANSNSIIFQLKAAGYQPILAHPERYIYFANDYQKFEKMKSQGCHFQVNLLSLAGHYGKQQQKLGKKLLRSGLVDYLGTDLHRVQHVKRLETIYDDREVMKLLEKTKFKNSEL